MFHHPLKVEEELIHRKSGEKKGKKKEEDYFISPPSWQSYQS
jgi:hypothetical protein